MLEELYTSGAYLEKNPSWHVEESPWKVREIARMMARNHLLPKTICEVGCGAGEILKLLQGTMDENCEFWGYEISPQAIEFCKSRANERLHFKLLDIRHEQNAFFDLILVMDVLEHLEGYFPRDAQRDKLKQRRKQKVVSTANLENGRGKCQ